MLITFSYLVVAVNVPKYATEISKTGPLHTFLIHLLWGLRVSASTDMVQPSPQLKCVSCSTTLSNFCRWKSNLAPLNRCMFAHCFNTIAISALPGELFCHLTTWSSHVAVIDLHVQGCGSQVAATSKYAIISCALSSSSVEFCVLYCVVNFVVVG